MIESELYTENAIKFTLESRYGYIKTIFYIEIEPASTAVLARLNSPPGFSVFQFSPSRFSFFFSNIPPYAPLIFGFSIFTL